MRTDLQLGLFEVQQFCNCIKSERSKMNNPDQSHLLICAAWEYSSAYFSEVATALDCDWTNPDQVLELIIEPEYREHVNRLLYGSTTEA